MHSVTGRLKGNMNYNKDLDKVLRGFGLTDMWQSIPQNHIYALHPTWSSMIGPHIRLTHTERPENWGRRSAGGFHRSSGRIFTYNHRFPYATTREGPMESKHHSAGGAKT